jgi:nucleoside-diphosphate kinase
VHQGKFFYEDLVGYISSSPVVVAVLEAPNAIEVVRAMIGKTRPHEAASGTIRGDLALAGLRNLVHASDAPETAASEVALYFGDAELLTYERDVDRWVLE